MTADDFSQVPPHDAAAEQCVLGGMMLSKEAITDVADQIGPGDHYRPAHQIVHEAILDLYGSGSPADVIAVADYLQAHRLLGKVGGGPYLHTLIASVPTAANAGYYARIVRKHAVLRSLIEAGTRIAQSGHADADDDELTGRIEAAYRVLDEATGKAVPPRARSLADLIGPVIDRIDQGPGERQGIPTGWADLGRLIPGYRAGQMITVGARPGAGKSVVLGNEAVHAGVNLGVPVLVCTLEMSSDEYIERILAFQASVNLGRIRDRNLEDADWQRLARAHSRLTACGNLMINDDPYMSVQSIRSDLRAMRRAGYPAQLVAVDYLGLIKSHGKTESREREISEFARGLKLLAKEFAVPVMVGSQLNRGPELRADHKPVLADLRDSGSVEQDSDIVILLYRDDMYEAESARAGEIDLIVAKNRQGQLGTATLAFRGHYAMCGDMYRPSAGEQYPEQAA